jgi:hypothetical protein
VPGRLRPIRSANPDPADVRDADRPRSVWDGCAVTDPIAVLRQALTDMARERDEAIAHADALAVTLAVMAPGAFSAERSDALAAWNAWKASR